MLWAMQQSVEIHRLYHFGVSRVAAPCTHVQHRCLGTTLCLLFELTVSEGTSLHFLNLMKDRTPEDRQKAALAPQQLWQLVSARWDLRHRWEWPAGGRRGNTAREELGALH